MAIVNGLISLAQAKSSIFNDAAAAAGTDKDADIESYISAATPVIEDITGPMVQRLETYERDGGKTAIALGVPFTAVTALLENDQAITDFTMSKVSGLIYSGTHLSRRRFQPGHRNISATVTVGLATIPPNIVLAARELVRFWWQQGRQGNRPAFGSNTPDTVEVSSGFAVPRRVVELCAPHRQSGGIS